MENKLPTAEDILFNELTLTQADIIKDNPHLKDFIIDAMIEFGRLCAKAALEEAAEKVKEIYDGNGLTSTGYRAYKSILESFDLNQIK